MRAMSNKEFTDAIMSFSNQSNGFSPYATYIPEGDCVEFFVAPDNYYAERIDDLVTVYYSRESGEIVGSLIKGVHGFLKQMAAKFAGFRITIEHQPVRLEHLFLARLWTLPSDEANVRSIAYKKLIELAELNRVEADVCLK